MWSARIETGGMPMSICFTDSISLLEQVIPAILACQLMPHTLAL
jgi:hypothetical protein